MAVSLRAANFLHAFRRVRSHWVEANQAGDGWEWYLHLTGNQLVMRRKVNGEWQYRSPTPEEEADYVASESW